MTKIKIDASWIRCGKCGHKLGRVAGDVTHPNVTVEIKCHSCKEINRYGQDMDEKPSILPVTSRKGSEWLV